MKTSVDSTVFIIEDDDAFCASVRELVGSVGLSSESFTSAPDFLRAFDPGRPGCLVVDVRMSRINGLSLQEHLIAIGARIPFVFVSDHATIAMAVQAMKNGAVDFLQKLNCDRRLLDAIDEALSRDMAQRVRSSESQNIDMKIAALTAREREVMSLTLEGLRAKAIANELAISYHTVQQYRGQVLKKLGVASVVDLIRLVAGRPFD